MPLRGLLLDLEGVLYEGGRTIAGAAKAVQAELSPHSLYVNFAQLVFAKLTEGTFGFL